MIIHIVDPDSGNIRELEVDGKLYDGGLYYRTLDGRYFSRAYAFHPDFSQVASETYKRQAIEKREFNDKQLKELFSLKHGL